MAPSTPSSGTGAGAKRSPGRTKGQASRTDKQKAIDGNKPKGALFTRLEVVEFILDPSEYTPDSPIENIRIPEPSFGDGYFLAPIVKRLMERYIQIPKKERPTPDSLKDCIRAIELDETKNRISQYSKISPTSPTRNAIASCTGN